MDFTQRYAQIPKDISPVLQTSGGQTLLVAARAAEIVPASDNADNDVFKFIITTTQIDRYNDVVVSKGGKLESYAKNPVVLWNHNSWDFPIGKSLTQQVNDKQIIADAQFHGETDDSLTALKLLRGGYLKATSIGFLPIDWVERAATEDEQLYYGNYTNVVREYTSWDLLEYSVVTVPANTGAVMTNAMLMQDPFIKALRRAYEDNVLSFDDPSVKKALQGYDPRQLRHIRPTINIKSIKRKTKMVSLTEEQIQQVVADFPPAVGDALKGYLVDSFAVAEEDAAAVAEVATEAMRQLLPQVLAAPPAEEPAEAVTNAFMTLAKVDKKGAKLSAKNKENLEKAITHMKDGMKTVKAVIDAAADGTITDEEVDDIEGKNYIERIKALEKENAEMKEQITKTAEPRLSTADEKEAFFNEFSNS